MAEYNNNDNIKDFTKWLAFSAKNEAFYTPHQSGGFMVKRDMGAALLLYLITCAAEETIAYKMETLREEPLDAYSSRLFRTFIFIEDFADRSEESFCEFLQSEQDKNIEARLLTEFVVYNFNTGTYRRIGGGKVQDKDLRKLLDSSSEAAGMSPEQRHTTAAEKRKKYRDTENELNPRMRKKSIIDPFVLLLFVNIAIFVFDLMLEIKFGYKPMEFFGIQHNKLVLEGEWWRLITSMFLHDDMSHLLGNMLMLIYLSRVLTRYYSDMQYFIIYMVSGISGSLFTLLFMDAEVRSLGASGAIMGLGGVLVYRMFFGGSPKAFRRAGNYFILTFMVVYNLVYGLFVENINNYAHFSGFAAGFLLAMLFAKIQRKKNIENQPA